MDGFSQNVQDIINKFHIRNEIDRLSEQDRLGLLIEKFVDPRINLSNRQVLNEDGSVKIEALDNHTMGTLFEEVIRMFNEETNVTDAGRHFTPRDIVELIADLAFIPVQDKIQSTTIEYMMEPVVQEECLLLENNILRIWLRSRARRFPFIFMDRKMQMKHMLSREQICW